MDTQNNIPDKKTYQSNRRKMAWASLAMILVTCLEVLAFPSRFEPSESILMMLIGSLSAVVAAYFGFSHKK